MNSTLKILFYGIVIFVIVIMFGESVVRHNNLTSKYNIINSQTVKSVDDNYQKDDVMNDKDLLEDPYVIYVLTDILS